jgi:hypothetical protein
MGKKFPYSVCAIMTLLMISRLWILFPKYVAEISGLRNEKTRMVGLLNNVNVANRFIMKHLLNSSLPALVGLFLFLVLTLAYAMVLSERPEGDNTNLDDYENAVWVIIITMTTVGYGDTYPKTPVGRGVAVVASLLAIVIVALVVNTVTEKLSLSRDESKVLDFVEDIESRQLRKHTGAQVIQRGWRAYKSIRAQGLVASGSHRRVSLNTPFSEACLVYSKIRSRANGISTDVPLLATETMVNVKLLKDKLDLVDRRVTEVHGALRTAVHTRPRTVSEM